MTLDTPDALLFDQTVTRIAGELASSATPTRSTSGGHGRSGSSPTRSTPWTSCPAATQHPRAGAGAVNLYVHLDPDQPGAVHDREARRRHRAAARRLAGPPRRPAARSSSDPSSTSPIRPAVDQHDPPAAMRELCLLRDAHCVFPGCRRDSRGCDLDHITAYLPIEDGGPPGQTHPGNLAPLCRTHHRMKTFTTWDYKRLDDGTYVWTSPDRTPVRSASRSAAAHPEEPEAPATPASPSRGHTHAVSRKPAPIEPGHRLHRRDRDGVEPICTCSPSTAQDRPTHLLRSSNGAPSQAGAA